LIRFAFLTCASRLADGLGPERFNPDYFANASDRKTSPHHQERQSIIRVKPHELLAALERAQPNIVRQFASPKIVHAGTEIVRLYNKDAGQARSEAVLYGLFGLRSETNAAKVERDGSCVVPIWRQMRAALH
jgi:hypothetical protein